MEYEAVRAAPPKEGGISLLNAVILVINAEAGAGILNFPEAFKRAGGILWALFLQFTFLSFTTVSLAVLNIVSAKYKSETLGELCFRAGGITLGLVSSVMITVYGMFSLTSYMVVIADNWDFVLYTLDRDGFCSKIWYYDRTFTVLLSSLVLILPNCFPKQVSYLRHAAQVGVFGIFYLTLLVNANWLFTDTTPGHIRTSPENFLEFVSALPTFCYAYHCHVQTVPVFHSLQDKTWQRILMVAVIGNMSCWLLFSSVGITGYLSFGDNVFENIIHNYDGHSPPVVLAIIFIIFKICFTYPIILFAVRKEVIWVYNFATNEAPQTRELKKRVTTVLIIFSGSVIMSKMVGTIGVAFGFSGTMIALYLFFFPGLLLLFSLLADEEDVPHYKKKFMLGAMLLVLGVLQFCLSLGLTIRRLVLTKRSPPRYLCD